MGLGNALRIMNGWRPEEKLSESKIFGEDWYLHNGDEVNGNWDHNFL
jgi:hypothetical protein